MKQRKIPKMASKVDRNLPLKDKLNLIEDEVIRVARSITRKDIHFLVKDMVYPDVITELDLDYLQSNKRKKELKEANVNKGHIMFLIKYYKKIFLDILIAKC